MQLQCTRKNLYIIRKQETTRQILHVITCKSWTLEKFSWQDTWIFNFVKIKHVKQAVW